MPLCNNFAVQDQQQARIEHALSFPIARRQIVRGGKPSLCLGTPRSRSKQLGLAPGVEPPGGGPPGAQSLPLCRSTLMDDLAECLALQRVDSTGASHARPHGINQLSRRQTCKVLIGRPSWPCLSLLVLKYAALQCSSSLWLLSRHPPEVINRSALKAAVAHRRDGLVVHHHQELLHRHMLPVDSMVGLHYVVWARSGTCGRYAALPGREA